jgi:hypothetical protein
MPVHSRRWRAIVHSRAPSSFSSGGTTTASVPPTMNAFWPELLQAVSAEDLQSLRALRDAGASMEGVALLAAQAGALSVLHWLVVEGGEGGSGSGPSYAPLLEKDSLQATPIHWLSTVGVRNKTSIMNHS